MMGRLPERAMLKTLPKLVAKSRGNSYHIFSLSSLLRFRWERKEYPSKKHIILVPYPNSGCFMACSGLMKALGCFWGKLYLVYPAITIDISSNKYISQPFPPLDYFLLFTPALPAQVIYKLISTAERHLIGFR